MLIDARRGLNIFDAAILHWLDEAECDYTVVMTKADAVGKALVVRGANDICMRYHAQTLGTTEGNQGPFVHVTSSRKGGGIVDLMWALDADFCSGANALRRLNKGKGGKGGGGSIGWTKDVLV